MKHWEHVSSPSAAGRAFRDGGYCCCQDAVDSGARVGPCGLPIAFANPVRDLAVVFIGFDWTRLSWYYSTTSTMSHDIKSRRRPNHSSPATSR